MKKNKSFKILGMTPEQYQDWKLKQLENQTFKPMKDNNK